MPTTTYRIGVSTTRVQGSSRRELSLCRADAPEEWHDPVLETFTIAGADNSWTRACEHHDRFLEQRRITKGAFDT